MRRFRFLLAGALLAAFVFSGVASAAAAVDIPGVPASFTDWMPVSLNSADASATHSVFSVSLHKQDWLDVSSENGHLGFNLFAPSATSVLTDTPIAEAIYVELAYGPTVSYETSISGTYFIDSFAPAGAGAVADGVGVYVTPYTSLKLNSAAAQLVGYNQKAGISLTLLNGDGQPSDLDVPVRVYRSVNGAAWSWFTTITSVNPVKSYVAPTTIRTSYKMLIADDLNAWTQPSTSAVKTVTPTAYLTNAVAPAAMARTKYYSVYGYLKPQHKAGTYPVRIYRYRYERGAWKSYSYVNAKAANYSNYTKYAASMRLPYAGRWRVRACAPADTGHRATWASAYDYVTVK